MAVARQLSLSEQVSGHPVSVAKVLRSSSELESAISLFTGAGGLDLGCEAAGFSTRAVVEADEMACETLRRNQKAYFPGLSEQAVFRDVIDLDYEQLLDAAGLRPEEPALLHGGPPCTPFSKSGYWLAYKRAGEDPKASLLDHYVRALEVVRPKAFLMENVYGLAYANQNRPILERFLAGVRSAGYAFDRKVLLAADFGVPQLRQRFFVVGVRLDLLDSDPSIWQFQWPDATHDGPHERRTEIDSALPTHRSTGDAFQGLDAASNPPEAAESTDGTYGEALRAVPPGDNYLYLTAKRGHPEPQFEWRSRYWSFLLKLHPDRPSPTIQGQPGPWVGPFHWDDRRLRVNELKRLMTFPDEFVVLGNRRQQQLQLGNAVPVQLAECLARGIAAELDRLGAGSVLAAA